MKRLLIAALLLGCAGVGFCADQPHSIGYVSTDGGPLAIYPRTVAQMNALTPYTTGQILYVSDGAVSRVCISSGSTSPGQWVVAVATGSFTAASYPHCQ
jgi:hypothetical protein